MEWLSVLGPTLLTLVGGGLGWLLRSRLEQKTRAEEALRNDRALVYVDVLTPFAQLLTSLAAKSQEKARREVMSLEYRKLAFRLVLIGDDDVVLAWNSLWKHLYEAEANPQRPGLFLLKFGDVLLAIRRSLTSKPTRLTNRDMLRWLIKDIETI